MQRKKTEPIQEILKELLNAEENKSYNWFYYNSHNFYYLSICYN